MHAYKKAIREQLAQECQVDSESLACHFDNDGCWVVFEDGEAQVRCHADAIAVEDGTMDRWAITDDECLVVFSDGDKDMGGTAATSECTPNDLGAGSIVEMFDQECDVEGPQSASCRYDDPSCFVVFDSKSGIPHVECLPEKDKWSITDNECLVVYSDDKNKNKVVAGSECTPNDLGAGSIVEMFDQECDVEGPQSASCRYDDPSCFVVFDRKSGVPTVECSPEMTFPVDTPLWGAYTPYGPSRDVYLPGVVLLALSFLPFIAAEMMEGRWVM